MAHSVGSISVIVTTYNRSEFLRNCLASIEAQTVPPDEVVVADDGSDAGHVESIEAFIRSSPLNIMHARTGHRGSRSANRNQGVRHASGDYLFFFEGDLVLFPDVIERHLEAADERRWIVGNTIRLGQEQTTGVSQESIGCTALPQTLGQDVLDRGLADMAKAARKFRRASWLSRICPTEGRFRRVRFASGHCSMPREMFEKVNGFDEAFDRWGWEDQDLGLRLQLAGFRGRCIAERALTLHLHHPPEKVIDPTVEDVHRAYYRRKRHGEFWCERGLRGS